VGAPRRRSVARNCGRFLFAATALACACACAPAPAADSERRRDGPGLEGDLAGAGLGRGWVVWESNRGGEFRIWIRPLEGGAARRLSPEEPGRDHCCAHLSPDGARVVFLSMPAGRRKYAPPTTVGDLRLVEVDGRRARRIAAARHYGEHRAALWWSDDQLAFIDGAGDSSRLDLSTGTASRLSAGPERGEGWLIDPSGRWATSSTAHFSPRDPATGEVRLATPLGGCQAWVAPDGQVGVWSAGAGGPIDGVELATRRTWTVLAKHDPRLPRDRGYLYFPMLSRDRTLLAVAASNDEHDHFRADYDVFLQRLDPASLRPEGSAVRVTAHPAIDRYPDVWRAGWVAPPALVPPAPAARPLAESGWPAAREGLAFLWQAADRANRIADNASSEILEERGEVWSDRRGRLALGGGSAAASPESAARLVAALRGANAVTVELVIEPATLAAGAPVPIFALGSGPRQRGLWIGRSGAQLELRVRTGETGPAGGAPAPLGRLPGPGPKHVAFTYSPGRLRTYLDGAPSGSPPWSGDFFPWRARELTLGAESGTAGSFRGALSHLAVYARELTAAEVAADAARALGELARASRVEILDIDATLLARSRLPTLDEISPYRRALVAELWRIESGAGARRGSELRVARWALLDGRPAAAAGLAIGARARLRLEPFDAQPQLASVVLSDTLPADTGARLWFDAGLGGER
jgi:hypothetical protein